MRRVEVATRRREDRASSLRGMDGRTRCTFTGRRRVTSPTAIVVEPATDHR